MISRRRAAELALLTAEATLRARAPDGASPPADLAEWCAQHAAVCPDLVRKLPQVSRLLRSWSATRPQGVFVVLPPLAGSSVRAEITTRETAGLLGITDSGVRWLASRDRFPGARRDRVTGRWRIPAAAVAAYRDRER